MGGTQSGKGYRLRSDHWKVVAVATRDGLKKKRGGGCLFIILSDRGAVRVSSTNISYQRTIVCIQFCS